MAPEPLQKRYSQSPVVNNPYTPPLDDLEGKEQAHIQGSKFPSRNLMEQFLSQPPGNLGDRQMDAGRPPLHRH